MDGLLDVYRLFRRDRQGRRGRGLAQCAVEGVECMELTTGSDTVAVAQLRATG